MFISTSTTGTGISKGISDNPCPLQELVAQGEEIPVTDTTFLPPQGRGAGRITTPSTSYAIRCRAIGHGESESLSVQVRTVKQALSANTQYRSLIFVWRHKAGNSVSAVAFPGHLFQSLLNDPTFRLSESGGKYHFNVSAGWEDNCQAAGIPYITTQTVTSY